MSDQHGYGGKESLGEESRSVDSESAGRSHMDFFSEHPIRMMQQQGTGSWSTIDAYVDIIYA